MLTYDASHPITVTQNNVSVIYNKWAVTRVDVQASTTGVSLTLEFGLANVTNPSGPVFYPGVSKTIGITDILTDADLSAVSESFFQAVIGKAIAQGVIS